MIANIWHKNSPKISGRHCYIGMEDATTVPTVVVTASGLPNRTVQHMPKDLIPISEVLQRRPTNRAERRAMKKGKK